MELVVRLGFCFLIDCMSSKRNCELLLTLSITGLSNPDLIMNRLEHLHWTTGKTGIQAFSQPRLLSGGSYALIFGYSKPILPLYFDFSPWGFQVTVSNVCRSWITLWLGSMCVMVHLRRKIVVSGLPGPDLNIYSLPGCTWNIADCFVCHLSLTHWCILFTFHSGENSASLVMSRVIFVI